VTVSRRYSSNRTWWNDGIISEAKAIGHLVEKAGLDRGKYAKKTIAETVEALRAEEAATGGGTRGRPGGARPPRHRPQHPLQ
jgi:hypothetical protein